MRKRVLLALLWMSACAADEPVATETEPVESVSGTTARTMTSRGASAVPGFGGAVDDGGDGRFVQGMMYAGSATFGPFTIPADGNIFIAHLSGKDRFTWARTSVGVGFAYPKATRRDAAGNLLVAGTYQAGPLDIGCGPLPAVPQNGGAAYLAKLSPSGDCVWARAYVPPAPPAGALAWGGFINDIAEDSHGNLVVVGSFFGQMTFRDDLVLTAPGFPGETPQRAFIARLTPAGETLWARMYGDGEGTVNDSGIDFSSVTADALGHFAVAGGVHGDTSVDLGATVLTADSRFVALFDLDADEIWTHDLGANTFIVAMAMNAVGSLAVAGPFDGTARFGRHTLEAVPFSRNAFIARYDVSGRDRWVTPVWGVSIPTMNAVAIKPNGTVYASGRTDLGGGLHLADVRYELPPRSHAGFVVKLNSTDGAMGWRQVFAVNDASVDFAALSVTTDGSVLATGTFAGTVDFGNGPVVGNFQDGMYLRLYP